MLDQDTMWRVVRENAKFDNSTLADIQAYAADAHFARERAMIRVPEPDLNPASEKLGLSRYLSDGGGIIAAARA